MLWIIGGCEVKHFEIKILSLRKCIPFIVINHMKCIKHYIMSRFPIGFVKELQGVYEFNEKLIINEIIKMLN